MPRYREIPNRPGFEAGDDGTIRKGLATGGYRLVKQSTDTVGYKVCRAGKCPDGKWRTLKVHRLVLGAWVGPPPTGTVACHNNGDRSDNRLCNLRWDYHSQNNGVDKRKHGTAMLGARNHKSKLTPADVHDIRRRLTAGESLSAIGRVYGISHVAVRYIRDKINWSWLD